MLNLLLLNHAVFAATLSVGGTGSFATISTAISAAIPGDTIEVSAGTYNESLSLAGKDLDIVGLSGLNQTFLVPPSGTIGVSWNLGESGSISGFTLQPDGARGLMMTNASVTVTDLLIDGGGSQGAIDGGAVYVSGGSPTFSSVEIRDSAGRNGGAFYLLNQASVAASNLIVEDTSSSFGGAFFVSRSTLTLTDTILTRNHATSSGGAIYLDDSDFSSTNLEIDSATGDDTWGVGIFARDRSSLSLTGGTIHDCIASNFANGYHGGGLRAEGNTVVSLDSVEFRDNTAFGGGGVSLTGDTAATLLDVVFDGNVASSNGGGLGLTSSSSVTCDGCTFTDNGASDGGAVNIRSASSFADSQGAWSGNTSTGDGGAIYVNAGDLTIADSAFTGNVSSGGGGAIFSYTPSVAITITDTTFQANTADSDDGGAIAAERSTDLTIQSCTFDSNMATFGSGGAIAWSSGFFVQDLRVLASDFEANEAGSDGGAIYMNRGDEGSLEALDFLRNISDGDGGAVFSYRTNQVSSIRSRFHKNSAAAGAGGAWYEVENQAGEGGGLAMSSTADSYVVNNTLVGNEASGTGAHLQAVGGTVRFINNVFSLGLDGGGIYGDATAAAGSDIYYNDAFSNSGGDYVGSFTNQVGFSGNIDTDPDLKDYSLDGDEGNDDLHLNLSSPCLDAGHPGILDVDATASDIGAYGGPEADVQDLDGDGYFDHVDCNDSDPSIFPTAIEVPYDGIDQDCDETDLRDVDGDGFEDGSVGGGDCDDNDGSIFPGANEIWYDGVDGDCDGGSDFDSDQDGYDASNFGGTDCDDTDAGVSPIALEVWYDGVDQDCVGNSDFDSDQDGYDSATFGGPDCNDTNATVYTGATEIPYDGFAQDCDGLDLTDVDLDGFDSVAVVGGIDCNDSDPNAYPGALDPPYNGVDEDCDGWSDYDADFDGFDSATHGGTDCDDTEPTVHPAAPETWYDGLDQDCDGGNDNDADQDGYPAEVAGGNDCDDLDPTTHPGSWETWYDGIDQDCLGDNDFDRDGDGFEVTDECDDARPEAYPGATELRNGMDDDCDGWAENEDGLMDWDEWQLNTDPENADSDGDGVQDGAEVPNPEDPPDSDLDTLIDPLDEDDDGDGINTIVEILEDPNDDGIPDVDVDGDGISNHLDRDSDGDGYKDSEEGQEDRDRDGVADYVDYTGEYAGGGCSGGVGLAGFFMLGAGLLRRKRMLGLLLLSGTSFAGGVDSHGFQLFGTTGELMRYSRLAYPDGGTRGDLDVLLVADHAVRPLVEVLDGTREPVVYSLMTTNLAVSGSVAPWTRLEVVLPVHPVGVARDGGFFAMGDMRLGAVVPAILPQGRRPGVGLAPSIWLPSGAESLFVGTPGLSTGGVITVAQELDELGWVVNVGGRVGRMEPDRNLNAMMWP